MGEAQDDFLLPPCEECGAGDGEPCAEDCAQAAAFKDLEWPDQYALPQPRSIEESLSLIATATHKLPFGGNVGLPGLGAPDRQDYSTEEYLDRLADWLGEYLPVLTAKVDDLQEQSRQRIGLQIERDVLDRTILRALEGAR